MKTPKYPHVEVRLSGRDGNAMAVLAAVTRQMKREGVPRNEVIEFRREAMSGDYDNLLQTCTKWVTVL